MIFSADIMTVFSWLQLIAPAILDVTENEDGSDKGERDNDDGEDSDDGYEDGGSSGADDSMEEDGDDDTRKLIFFRIMQWVEANYSESQSIAFKRVVIDHRPAREVAEELKLTPNVVYQNKSRILAKIRSVFQDLV